MEYEIIAAFSERCTGRKKHCYYPAYVTYDFDSLNVPSCEDYSDRIFKNNSICTIDRYIVRYCETFCGVQISEYGEYDNYTFVIDKEGRRVIPGSWCDYLCVNTSAWLSENPDEIYLSHHCQDSCSEPGYGCQACTNTSYILCNINGEPHCIHPKLVCDGQKTCDMGEDEELTTECIDKLVRLGDIDEAATLLCKSIQDPG